MARRTLFVGMAAATLVLATVLPAAGQTTFLFMHSQPGDYIGVGLTRTLTPSDGNFSARRNSGNGVSVNLNGGANWWNLDFVAPQSVNLAPGAYENAARFPFQSPTQPGLSVYGEGRGCNTLTGRFDVFEVVYGSGDTVLAFAANFEQHCEGQGPALFGSIRYQAATIAPHLVTVTRTGDGAVTSLPGGISCGADCTETFTQGTVVALLALPAAGQVFSGWSGDADCSDGVISRAQAVSCQAAFVPCSVTLSPIEATGTILGGSGTVSVVAGPSCSWSAAASAPWLRILGPMSGTGSAEVPYVYDPRGTFAQPRSGTIAVSGEVFTLTQPGIVPTFSVTPAIVEANPGAGAAVVQVQANAPDAIWTATAHEPWLSVPASGAIGTVSIGVARNASTDARNGSVTIGGDTVLVQQRGNGIPGEPAELGAAVRAGNGHFEWLPPSAGGDATDYQIEAGLTPGASTFVFHSTDARPDFDVAGVPSGRFYLRVRGRNEYGVGVASEEYELAVAQNGMNPPGRPRNVTAALSFNRLSMTWDPPAPLGALDGYELEVGTETGATNIAVIPLGLTTTFSYDNVPPGFYFLRVRGHNAAGRGDLSREVLVVAGGVNAPPASPTLQPAVVNGSTVNLAWLAGAGSQASQYRIEVGSKRGLADLAALATPLAVSGIGFSGVPSGRYYVRVRGVNAHGAGPVSNDVRVDVP